MLNHEYRKNCRAWQGSKLSSALTPNYLFPVEIPNLFSMFIFWFLRQQKLDKCFNTGRCNHFPEDSEQQGAPALSAEGHFPGTPCKVTFKGSASQTLQLLQFQPSPTLCCSLNQGQNKREVKAKHQLWRKQRSPALNPALWKDME